MNDINAKVVMLKGESGSSISNLEKTATDGLIDTYTITLTDGKKYSFNVTNGKGIKSIAKTSTSGLTDTYTITYNDGTTSTFMVTNGTTAYPVGSIYLSVNDTSPAEFFGGTWERIKDCFMLAAGDTYAAGSTGGEAQHTLSQDEMPTHRHSSDSFMNGYAGASTETDKYITWVNKGDVHTNAPIGTSGLVNTTYVGGSKPHNNMPPYLAVYMWKRIS